MGTEVDLQLGQNYVKNMLNIQKKKNTMENTWKWWWRHQMETFSALLASCAGNSPVTDEFLAQSPVTWSFDVFSDLPLNQQLSKQWKRWWFETPSLSLWRHCNNGVEAAPKIWANRLHESTKNSQLATIKQNTSKPIAYLIAYIVFLPTARIKMDDSFLLDHGSVMSVQMIAFILKWMPLL